jgi:hypothetical protein
MPILGGGNFPGAVVSEPKQIGRISGPLLKANLERKGIDLAFETDLLYLDVQCRKIGIGKKVVCNTSTSELEVIDSGISTVDILIDLEATANGVVFDADSISSTNNSDFVIESAQGIIVPKLATDDLVFSGTTISTTQTDISVNITPTGRTNFDGTTNVTGNVFIDGNALYFSTVVQTPLPQTDVDALVQDLRPATDNTGSVGNALYSWDNAYFKNVRTNNLVLPNLPPGFSVPLTHPGNSLYVSDLGSDTNFGTIQTSPFKSIAKALSVATAGITVFVTTGTYTEVFPLIVPAGVSIIGQSLRSVKVQPTVGTIDKDAFLLNGETSIEDLTVTGFRYNVANNTGHAFRFAQNTIITTKSPYIRNVSVITKGSTITLSDPLSYDSHDAGRGAYIDGSVMLAASTVASMLFYGVTFITPGVDAIVMTNGVRVESIDCFTYYANRGYYAIEGLAGLANLGLVFGAEIRCISCANVYGKYGFVGNGASVIAYLVGHNFAYIGTEKDSSNDITLRVQANEQVELNGAKIQYASTDNGGDFRIGDNFLVNFKKGTTSFSGDSFDLSGLSVITVSDGNNTTLLAPYKIESNNFRISGSTIETISGPINFKTATGIFLLDDNVNVGKNLTVSGNIDFKGTITVGNQSTDTVTITMDLGQDIVPNLANTYKLGSSSNRWQTSWFNKIDLPSLTIDNNTITAINENLIFIGNGTAGVDVDSLTFTNNILSAVASTNIVLKTATGYPVYIDSTASLRLPSGTSSDKPIMNSGELRYDTVLNQFVGQSTFRTALGGVYSANRTTKVVAHPTNNTIPFVINGTEVASLSTTSILATAISVDSLTIDNNTISTSGTTDIIFGNTGNSHVLLNNIKIDGSNIINTTNNAVVLPGTKTSYVKFGGTKAILVPVNNMLTPTSMEIGTIRFNPNTQCMEVWDGDSFDNFGGIGGNATEDDVEQLTNLWTLILG